MRMSRRIGVYSGGGRFDGSTTIGPGETKELRMHGPMGMLTTMRANGTHSVRLMEYEFTSVVSVVGDSSISVTKSANSYNISITNNSIYSCDVYLLS